MRLNLRNFSCFALLTFSSFAFASGQTKFGGSVEGPNGQEGDTEFKYDTGNGSGTFIDHETAVEAGLGTVDSDGNFTPTGDATSGNANRGAYTFWCFADVKVTVTDSNGGDCTCEVRVCVAKNTEGSNKHLSGTNLLSQEYINCVGACAVGAGSELKAYWKDAWTLSTEAEVCEDEVDPQLAERQEVDGESRSDQTFQAEVWNSAGPEGPEGEATTVTMIYGSGHNYTYLPSGLVEELGLEITGEIDLEAEDPDEYLMLALKDRVASNQSQYPMVEVSVQVAGAPVRTATALLFASDADSAFGILGGEFAQDIAYAQDDETENDAIAYMGSMPIDTGADSGSIDMNPENDGDSEASEGCGGCASATPRAALATGLPLVFMVLLRRRQRSGL